MQGDYGLNQRPVIRPQVKMSQEAERRVVYKGYPIYLPDDETLEKFKEAYPDMTNEELTAITHRSVSYNSRIGNYLGLEKSEAFLERRKSMVAVKARQNHTKGKPKKGECPEHIKQFRFGQPNGNKAISSEAKSEQMKKMWAAERMREKYGLQRQTKLKLKR